MKRVYASILILGIISSCGYLSERGGGKTGPDEAARVDMLTRLEHLAYQKRFEEVSRRGREYLERLSGTEAEGKARILIARAELEIDRREGVGEMVKEILADDYPDHIKAEALLIRAGLRIAEGASSDAVEDLVSSTLLNRSQSHLAEAEKILKDAAAGLDRDEIRELAGRYRSSSLAGTLREIDYSRSPEGIPSLNDRYDPYSGDSLASHSGDRFRVGLICPASGKYAALGRSFIRGAYVALKEGREKGIENVELVVGDTRASALESQVITGRLIEEENVDIIIGGISNASTIAAAQIAQANSTVIFSPVSNLEGIDAIGDYVFQVRTDYEAEVIAVARVAVNHLGVGRIAFLAADNRFNRELELLFRAEVEREGGMICIADYYSEGSTDFRENIERIRKSAPEALFIPAEKNDLVLILPQLSFYEFGVQLLGLSMWDSSNLIYMSGKDMAGAVFPAETEQDFDRELYLSAAAFVNEPVDKVNHFEVRGYVGMRRIIDVVSAGFREGGTVRERIYRLLNNRAHPFIRAAGEKGITFYTVRNGEKEKFLTYKFPFPRRK